VAPHPVQPPEQYTDKQKEKYRQDGIAYQALMEAFHAQSPTLQAAEAALCKRLLADLGGVRVNSGKPNEFRRGGLVPGVYRDRFAKVPECYRYDWAQDAAEFTSEYVDIIMAKVRSGYFTTGQNLFGFRTKIRAAAWRRVCKEITKAGRFQPLAVKDEGEDAHPDDEVDNPDILEAQTGHVTALPLEALDVLTDEDRWHLAALEAHGGDRVATAACVGMKKTALDKSLERIMFAASIENLTLRLIDLGESRASASALAPTFLPLVPVMRIQPKNSLPISFDALDELPRAITGKPIQTGYHAAVRKILLLWRDTMNTEMSNA
jgi:hypothetical protein